MAGVAAAHPRRFAGERHLLADLQIGRRRDLRAQHDITVKPLGLDLEHERALRLGIDEFARLPAFRQVPLQLSGHADDAGKAPVGVPAAIMIKPKADREGLAGNDGGLLRDELNLKTRLSK
jgi:hypothetical protein